ncbi:phasin family protein [Enterovirga rhinocerotis]|uniref:phasin family protein n=1 Tax=Enterovirga rhinocerotis TaxID=1339210 RepID=UPI001414D531|nr:phasin family protein [Enterovirga rhinocerotis]
MAEKNVEQAREAYGRYITATQKMLDTLDDASRQVWSGAKDVNMRVLSFAEANAQAGFDYAGRLVQAKTTTEFAAIQQDYLRQATERLVRQIGEMNDLAREAARDIVEKAKPKG